MEYIWITWKRFWKSIFLRLNHSEIILWRHLERTFWEFQGRLSHVSSQPCFAQPRQKIASWYIESIRSTGKRFWKSIFYVNSPRDFFSKNFIWQRAKKSRSSTFGSPASGKKQVWQVKTDKIMAQFQLRCLLQDRSLTTNYSAELRGQTAKTENIGTAIRQISLSIIILGVENKIQNTGLKWFWLSVGSYVVGQRSGDGWFFGRIKSLAICLWKGFSKIWDAGREDCLGSEQYHPEFTVYEEV